MPFYKVRCREDQKETNYDLAQERTPEGAIIVFNATYGRKLGVELTTVETEKPCRDYLLIEQENDCYGHLLKGRDMVLYHK